MTTKTKKTRIPEDYAVSEELRAWAAKKHGAMHLPDVFLTAFKDHFEQSGKAWMNWDRVMQTWVNRASPSGEFYNDVYWAKQLRAAKSMESRPARTTQPPAVVAGRYVDAQGMPLAERPLPAVNASDVAKRVLAEARARLGVPRENNA